MDTEKAFEVLMDNIECIVGDYEGESFLLVYDGFKEIEELEEKGYNFEELVKAVTGSIWNWGFSDEFTTCCGCGNIIRISPDSYSWLPEYFITDGEIFCKECVKIEPDEYIENLINNPEHANTIFNDEELQEIGFKKLNKEYEAGFYHIWDDPKEVFNQLKENYNEIIFSITNQEQFRINYTVYIREE